MSTSQDASWGGRWEKIAVWLALAACALIIFVYKENAAQRDARIGNVERRLDELEKRITSVGDKQRENQYLVGQIQSIGSLLNTIHLQVNTLDRDLKNLQEEMVETRRQLRGN